MAKKFEIRAGKVTGYCACGYRVEDVFNCEGPNGYATFTITLLPEFGKADK